MLSPESAAAPGKWNTDRAPYERGVMDSINDPAVETIVWMKSAQVGASEVGLNIIGYFIDQDPCPILMITPTLQASQDWSKDRLYPMLRDTPCLTAKVSEEKSRDSDSTILHKRFLGGHITAVGANSPSGLRMRPIRIVMADDIDAFSESAGGEGDPLTLASKRATTFFNRKKIFFSTPTIKGLSRIAAAFDESDQRFYMVPCPECGSMIAFEWKQMKWEKDKDGNHLPETSYHECVHCQYHITDQDKNKMLRDGEWVATKPFNGTAGFHIWEAYSPWVKFPEIVEAFLEAKHSRNRERLKAFVNTVLGETFEDAGETVGENDLLARREQYGPDVPAGVLVLTAAVDVQDNRLECEIVGWGAGDESWGIEYKQFMGDPNKPEAWAQVDEFISTRRPHVSGMTLPISCVTVDSGGHHTNTVYKFTKSRELKRVYSIKGFGGANRPLITRPTINNAVRAQLFIVGVDEAKATLYHRLKLGDQGPGYCHFPHGYGYDEGYFKQLTAEERVVKFKNGFKSWFWRKKSAWDHNEALDIRVYNMASLSILNVNYDKLKEFLNQAAIEAKREKENLPTEPKEKVENIRRHTHPFATRWKDNY